MKPPKRRLAGFGLGVVASMLALDTIERHRAVEAPSGWQRTNGEPLAVLPRTWRLGTSAWRVGPGSTWVSEEESEQVYLRAQLPPQSRIGLSLSNHKDQALWIWLDASGQVSAIHDGVALPCMGKLPINPESHAIELKTDSDGLMVSREDHKMICPRDEEGPLLPQVKTDGGAIELRSIGRDRRSDGVPLSPLWWMSGLMGLCFVWMVIMDTLIGAARKILPQTKQSTTAIEE